jgi:hypothetical protein
VDDIEEVRSRQRFQNHRNRPSLGRRFHLRLSKGSCVDNAGRRRYGLVQVATQLNARTVRQAQIQNDDTGFQVSGNRIRLGDGSGLTNDVQPILGPQGHDQRKSHIITVVDYDQAGRRRFQALLVHLPIPHLASTNCSAALPPAIQVAAFQRSRGWDSPGGPNDSLVTATVIQTIPKWSSGGPRIPQPHRFRDHDPPQDQRVVGPSSATCRAN